MADIKQGNATLPTTLSWQLLRYARFLMPDEDSKSCLTSSAKTKSEQKWKYISPAARNSLVLSLTNSHMLLTNGETILENYYLPDMRSTMRGFVRGDSLLLVIKIKNEARKFRVRFGRDSSHPTALVTCEHCAALLSHFFPIKPYKPVENLNSAQMNEAHSKEGARDVMTGDVSVRKLSEVLKGDVKDVNLPLPYNATLSESHLDSKDLNELLRLFLTEASFPALVGDIERELAVIAAEDES